MQVSMGYPEPRANSSLPRLKLVLNGVSHANCPQQRTRDLDFLLLHRSYTGCSQCFPPNQHHMIGLCYGLPAPYAFLDFSGYIGKITIPSKSAFDQARHLAWEDVRVDDRAKPSMLCIHLKVSKFDQFGKGVDVFVSRTGHKLCPVASYLACGPTAGPFFRFQDRKPLTKGLFISKVRDLLSQASLDPSLYVGHSYRIGTAILAALVGLEEKIQLLELLDIDLAQLFLCIFAHRELIGRTIMFPINSSSLTLDISCLLMLLLLMWLCMFMYY